MLSKLAEELARFLSPWFSCDGGHFAPQRLPAYCGVRCAQPTAGRCHRALRACRCPPSGNSAAATSGRVRFDSPKRPPGPPALNQPHTAFTVRSCLDPASILFCGRLTATYHYCTEQATLRTCIYQAQSPPTRTPVHCSSRQTLCRSWRITSSRCITRPLISQNEAPTHRATNQRQPTAPKCWPLTTARHPENTTHPGGGYLRLESSYI